MTVISTGWMAMQTVITPRDEITPSRPSFSPAGGAMRAAYLETTGAPEVIRYGELPTPTPGPGEVRIRVSASSVNPIDVYIRSGIVKMPLPVPYIPGCDVAGTVDAVGPGATSFRPGDRVWGSNQGLLGRQGTLAEYCCASEEWLYPLPPGV